MKTTQIALTLGLALASNLAAAQANINVAVNVTVPPCTVALQDATNITFNTTAADIAAAPNSTGLNFNPISFGSSIAPFADVGVRNTSINLACPVPQRVMMKFNDTANDVWPGSHRIYALKSGAGDAGFIGAYNIAFNGKPMVDGVENDVVYRWSTSFSDWRAPIMDVFLGGTYEYAFADAGSLTPKAVSSAVVPVSIRVALSKARVAAAAVGGVIPPISGATTITVHSF
jgi:hypothetical protein